jgi:hypothetical protein
MEQPHFITSSATLVSSGFEEDTGQQVRLQCEKCGRALHLFDLLSVYLLTVL